MKIKLYLIVALAAVTLTYTSCKKSGSGPANTVSEKQVSQQIALNLTQTLYGGFGGFNIFGGLNPPSNLDVLKKGHGLKLNDFSDDFGCGLSIDTTMTYSTPLDGGGSASISGQFKFSVLCTNNTPNGMSFYTKLKMTESTAQISATYNLGENLSIITTDPNNEVAPIIMNGSVNVNANVQQKTGSKSIDAETFDYAFTNIKIDPTVGEIVSGSATFATKGATSAGTWEYTGTITFLPDNKAKIVINGTTYTVDLQTGTVS
jgi:hypothetical protein